MNKRLEELLESVPHWPPAAQADAVSALANIESRIAETAGLSDDERQKLKALHEMIERSIAEGGDYSPDDIDAMIDEMVARSSKAR